MLRGHCSEGQLRDFLATSAAYLGLRWDPARISAPEIFVCQGVDKDRMARPDDNAAPR